MRVKEGERRKVEEEDKLEGKKIKEEKGKTIGEIWYIKTIGEDIYSSQGLGDII